MAASDTRLTVGMDKTASVPIFTFTDLTEYSEIAVTVARGTLRVSVNGASIYDNLNDWALPDINTTNGQSRDDTQSVAIPLPLDENGEIINGSYRFQYSVRYDATSGAADAVNEITMDLVYNKVEGFVTKDTQLVPVTAPSLTITDETNYVVDNVTPSLVRSLSFTQPSPGGTSTTTASVLVLSQFYTGIGQAWLQTTATYDYSLKILTTATNNFTSGNFILNIIDQINDVLQIVIQGAYSICQLYCCINDYGQRLQNLRTSNPTAYLNQQPVVAELSLLLNLIDASYSCGKGENIEQYVARVKAITNCTDDCGCGDDPVLITGVATSTMALGNCITFVTTTNTTSYQNLNFTGKTYNSTQRDFLVFVDGIRDYGSFNSTTYTYTFANTVVSGVTVEINFLR